MSPPLRVVLADDEPLALDRLAFAFRDLDGVDVVGMARSGPEAADLIARTRPDLAVLDIQMPGRTGLGVVADLDERMRPEVIFLTAFEQHAVDAFDLDAADYLLKPLRLDRLRQAVERARRRLQQRTAGDRQPDPVSHSEAAERSAVGPHDFWVQDRTGLRRVPLADVEWIEAAKDYVLLHTAARSHILRATMAGLESQLPEREMMRVHRSAFVSPSAVKALHSTVGGGATLILADEVAVPVGPTYLPAVLSRFASRVG